MAQKARYNYDYMDASDKKEAEYRAGRPYYSTKPLTVDELDEALVLPPLKNPDGTKKLTGGVVCNGIYYDRSYVHRDVDSFYKADPDKAIYRDEEAVYIGCLYNVWGHSITDCLKLMWFLQDPEYDWLKEKKFVYISINNGSHLLPNFLSILNRIGVKAGNIEEITELTIFKKLYLPEDCFYHDNTEHLYRYTDAYLNMIDILTRDIAEDNADKVFFTRSRIKGYRDMGEKYVEQAFKKAGYSIYSPELLTFEEQVALLKGCKEFAAPQGSIAHNAIFLKPGTKCVIVRKAPFFTGYQNAINEAKGLDVTLIDSHRSTMVNKSMMYAGPFFVYVNKRLSSFLGIKKPAFPLEGYIRYMFYGILRKILRK